MKPTLIAGIIIIGTTLLFGTKKVLSHTETFVNEIREEVNRLSPAGHEAERIRHLLQERGREIAEYRGKLRDLQRKSIRAGKDAGDFAIKIGEHEEVLKRASVVLERHEPVSEINGRHYDRIVVERDTLARVSELEDLRLRWDTKVQIAKDLTRAAGNLEAKLLEAELLMRNKKLALESLDVRLESAALQALARSMTEDLLDASFEHSDELTDTWHSYVERVESAESASGSYKRHSDGELAVAWYSGGAETNALQAIAAALGNEAMIAKKTPDAPSAVTPSSEPADLWLPSGVALSDGKNPQEAVASKSASPVQK